MAPFAVVVAALVARPEIVRGTFSTTAGTLRVGAVVAGWIALRWTVRRLVTDRVVRSVLIGVPTAVVLWLWVVPYFQNETVNEALPVAPPPTAAPAPTTVAPPPTALVASPAPAPAPAAAAVAGPPTAVVPAPAPAPA
ncbi:MAG: hypothetical protein ABIW46_06300, partial [Acidimicrobiales bacterium]